MKICVRCGVEKNISEFHNCKRSIDSKNPACAKCINGDNSERRNSGGSDRIDFRSGILSMKDYCRTLEVLGLMGYDITKSIHEQFCEKYNLPQKEIPLTNKLKWNLQDCINNEQ